MVLHEILEKHSIEKPHALCLVYKGRSITYKSLYETAKQLAFRLASSSRKCFVGCILLSSPLDTVVYLYALSMAGIASVIIDPALQSPSLDRILDRVKPELIIDESIKLPPESASMLPQVQENDRFLGILSSGSTGEPKVIWKDHACWTKAFHHQSALFNISCEERLYLCGSLSYSANLNSCLHILHTGGCVYFASGKMPSGWLQEIEAYRITSLFMVPAHYRLLIKHTTEPISSLTSAVSAGAKLDPDTALKMTKVFNKATICEYYGAAELGHVSYAYAHEVLEHPGSVGKAFPDVKISVLDGQIWVESPYMSPDYRPCFSVGDLGCLDENGFLTLYGRSGDIINKAGTKISTVRVESTLRKHKAVDEVCAMGIHHPKKGQTLCVWVVKKPGLDLTQKDLRDYCSKELDLHSRPQKILFIKELPINVNGKVDKKLLLHTLSMKKQ